MITVDIFRAALSQLAAGVSIVTTARGDDRRGVTATAVCSVSAEPPLVLACVNRDTGTYKMIAEAGVFAINFAGQEHRAVAETFAGRSGVQGDARFGDADWTYGTRLRVPVLRAGATTLECEVHEIVKAGTHGVVIGLIRNAAVGPVDPLLFHDGRFHSLMTQAMRIAS